MSIELRIIEKYLTTNAQSLLNVMEYMVGEVDGKLVFPFLLYEG